MNLAFLGLLTLAVSLKRFYQRVAGRETTHFDFPILSDFAGSRFFQGRGVYGPWRSEPGTFKVKGGAGLDGLPDLSNQPDPGAPCSSTSVRTCPGTVTNGTPQARLARLTVDIMEDDNPSLTEEVLTPGQRALYDLCKQDLFSSCLAYEQGWNRVQGQQFLVD